MRQHHQREDRRGWGGGVYKQVSNPHVASYFFCRCGPRYGSMNKNKMWCSSHLEISNVTQYGTASRVVNMWGNWSSRVWSGSTIGSYYAFDKLIGIHLSRRCHVSDGHVSDVCGTKTERKTCYLYSQLSMNTYLLEQWLQAKISSTLALPRSRLVVILNLRKYLFET